MHVRHGRWTLKTDMAYARSALMGLFPRRFDDPEQEKLFINECLHYSTFPMLSPTILFSLFLVTVGYLAFSEASEHGASAAFWTIICLCGAFVVMALSMSSNRGTEQSTSSPHTKTKTADGWVRRFRREVLPWVWFSIAVAFSIGVGPGRMLQGLPTDVQVRTIHFTILHPVLSWPIYHIPFRFSAPTTVAVFGAAWLNLLSDPVLSQPLESFTGLLFTVLFIQRALEVQARVSYIRSVTFQEAAEERAEFRSANKAVKEFCNTLAHELRNPLSGIIGNLELANDLDELPGEAKRYLNGAFATSEHMLHILNDVLELGKVESGMVVFFKEMFTSQDILTQCVNDVQALAAKKGLTLDIHHEKPRRTPGEHHTIVGDSRRLRQIIGNLMVNSIKFTESGSIRLLVSEAQDEGMLDFTVEDTGIGMSEKALNNLFVPYVQAEGAHTSRKYGGTGLGLSIAEKMLHDLGGVLQVYSELGKGSRFVVTVPQDMKNCTELPKDPMSDIDSADGPQAEAFKKEMASKLSAVVVDDDKIICGVLSAYLKKIGVKKVQCFLTRKDASTFIDSEAFDTAQLFLVDGQLDQGGTDGAEVCKLIRAREHESGGTRHRYVVSICGGERSPQVMTMVSETREEFGTAFDEELGKPLILKKNKLTEVVMSAAKHL